MIKTFEEFLEESLDEVVSSGETYREVKKRTSLHTMTPNDEAFLKANKPEKKKTGTAHVTLKWSDNTTDKTKIKLTGPEHKWEDEAKEKAEQHLKNMKRGASALPHKPQPTGIHKVEVK